MFYSETLLSKTGPLARVWLSANLERKLSKSHILQSNIETSVGAIVGQDQAPMALRLSGQLLLGVVRIYSRKARYLLEDCNEALMKIKMAFRPGNVDLPSNATTHNAAQLTLPDAITELDLLLPDPTLDLGDLDMGDDLPLGLDPKHTARGKITLDDDETLYIDSQPRGTIGDLIMEPELDLDLGEDIGIGKSTRGKDFSELLSDVEIGRDAPMERSMGADFFNDSNLSDLGLEEPSKARIERPRFELEDDIDLGINLGDDDMGGLGGDFGLGGEGDTTIQPLGEKTPVPEEAPVPMDMEIEGEQPEQAERERSDSPLSSVRSSVERQISTRVEEHIGEPDVTFAAEADRMESEEMDDLPGRATTTRRRKLMIDSVTEIKAKQIKHQQEDRSRILREPSFLARDPRMLALMSIATNGTIAHTIFRPRTINVDLANLLSPEFVARMAATKLKRDAGHLEDDEEVEVGRARKQPRLEIPEEIPEEEAMAEADQQLDEPSAEILEMETLGDVSMPQFGDDEPQFDMPIREGTGSPQPEIQAQGEESVIADILAETLPPAPPAAISRETRNAVHVLREQFSEPSPKKTVVFQELLPENTTTRIDATKLFFEVLVLATKDALTVKQSGGFDKIEIGQKQALWGAWAEEKDEQQVAEELEKAAEEEAEAEVEKGRGGRTVRPRRDVVVGAARVTGEASGAA
ncbi:Rec8 like protein-domain-containing protein [Geopyxis carbonaria]|nr:Rec8 like protein-domain-containing protein [Geopyxis carbonaria]